MSSWTEEYWDIMARAYEEPEKFFTERKKDLCPVCKKKKAPYTMKDELRAIEGMKRKEVSLNDILNLVFRLAPSNFIPRLVGETFKVHTSSRFETVGRQFQNRYGWGDNNYTQPDLLYFSPEATFALELKTPLSRSNLKQAVKYAALVAAEEKVSGKRPIHFLLFLTPKQKMEDAFREVGYSDEAALKAAMLTSIEEGAVTVVPHDRQHLKDAIQTLRVTHVSYEQFETFLNSWLSGEVETSAETLDKLLEGLKFEMRAFGALRKKAHTSVRVNSATAS